MRGCHYTTRALMASLRALVEVPRLCSTEMLTGSAFPAVFSTVVAVLRDASRFFRHHSPALACAIVSPLKPWLPPCLTVLPLLAFTRSSERATGIGPAYPPWEDGTLPLRYTRRNRQLVY